MTRRLPLTLIVAMSENRTIGKDGALPWRLSEDLKHFKRVTMGHAVIMGRKTFDSMGRPLKGRRNIVVSRNRELTIDGCDVVPSVESAIRLAREGGDEEPMIIGGASIYAEALPLVTRIWLTLVHRQVEGDTSFPQLEEGAFREVERQDHGEFSILRLERSDAED